MDFSKIIGVVLCGTFIQGCNFESTDDGRSIACTTEAVPGLEIEVYEQETGYANACGATVAVSDGSYIEEETYESSENCDESYTFQMAFEREGTYDISITKEGFEEWVQTGIEVTENVCHVNSITIEAYLTK